MKLKIIYVGKNGQVRLTETRELIELDMEALLGLSIAYNTLAGRTTARNQVLGAIRGIVGYTSSYRLRSIQDNEDSSVLTINLQSRG